MIRASSEMSASFICRSRSCADCLGKSGGLNYCRVAMGQIQLICRDAGKKRLATMIKSASTLQTLLVNRLCEKLGGSGMSVLSAAACQAKRIMALLLS